MTPAGWRLAAAAALVVVVLLFGVPLLMLAASSGDTATAAAAACLPVAAPPARDLPVDAEQQGNAATITAVGQQLRVPAYGWVVAVATALQESGLRNLPDGNADSVGLFQQRDSWGSYAERHDPAWAAAAFYRALLKVPGWQQMTVTVAAQAVQASAFPDAYARWESLARALVGAGAAGCVDATMPGVVPASAQAGAQALLRLWGTRIDGNPGARHDLAVTASGVGEDRCGHHVAVDVDLERLLLTAARRYKLTIWNFITDHSCDPYYHPPGMATDLGAVTELSTGRSTNFLPGSSGNDPAVVAGFVDYLAAVGPNHLGLGQLGCADHAGAGPGFVAAAFTDLCTHQHINTHQNDPQYGPYRPETWP